MHLWFTRPVGPVFVKRVLFCLLLGGGLAVPGRAQAQGRDLVVRALKWKGNKSLSPAALEARIATTNSSFFARQAPFSWLGFLGQKRYLNETDFQRDVLRIGVLYKLSGFPDAKVDTIVRRTPTSASITFVITEGAPIRVDTLRITGLDSLEPKLNRAVALDLPLQQGDVFDRQRMRASADTMIHRLRDRGYPSADVFLSFNSRHEEKTAQLTMNVVPGVRAVVGTVKVEGTEHIDSAFVVRLMEARPGRLYSAEDLFASQRNLYNSDHFRLASVNIDTSAFRVGMDSVPLIVRVTESPPYHARAGLGYGTSDCLRANGGFAIRNFLGHAKLLDITGGVSKVGTGRPLDWGLENSGICSALKDDSVGSRLLNYNLTASLRRPAFRSPNNILIISGFTERRSEFKVYQRTEQGVSVSIARESPRRRLPLSLTYTLSLGRTSATPASFCAFLNACDPADVERLGQRIRQATLTGSVSVPRANNPLDPSRGSIASLQATVASRFIGSSSLSQFTRVVGDYTKYFPLTREIVFSWHLRGGVIFSPNVALASGANPYIPPDQRFYGGGPNDVRGYQRNELGPVAYTVSQSVYDTYGAAGLNDVPDSVRVVPTGGNSLAVANAELRLPSPFFKERLRLAAFVDAGTVWERGRTSVSKPQIRITPGVGLRVATPLGPARFDVAYNPYKLPVGTLYVRNDADGSVQIIPDGLQLDRHRKITIHFAVGQPF